MNPARFRECLRQIRWTSIDIVNALQCDLAWIEALEAGEIVIPNEVAIWLGRLASFHAENSPPATFRQISVLPKSARVADARG